MVKKIYSIKFYTDEGTNEYDLDIWNDIHKDALDFLKKIQETTKV